MSSLQIDHHRIVQQILSANRRKKVHFIIDIVFFFRRFHWCCSFFCLFRVLSWKNLQQIANYSHTRFFVAFNFMLNSDEFFSVKLWYFVDLSNVDCRIWWVFIFIKCEQRRKNSKRWLNNRKFWMNVVHILQLKKCNFKQINYKFQTNREKKGKEKLFRIQFIFVFSQQCAEQLNFTT